MGVRSVSRRTPSWLGGILGVLLFAACAEPGSSWDAHGAQPRVEAVRLIELLPQAEVQSERDRGVRERQIIIGNGTLRGLFEHPDASIRFPAVLLGRRPLLQFFIGLEDGSWEKGSDGAGFEVLASHAGQAKSVFRHEIGPSDRGWRPFQVDLAGLEGQSVTLTLRTTKGPSGKGLFDWAYWGDPVLTFGGEPRPFRPNVLLVSFDTLRADFLGAYGAQGVITPHLDALAHRGTVFDMAISQSAWTRPAHFSMLSGLYPDLDLLRYDLSHCGIEPDVRTLAEVLREQGYLTAAFTGGGYVSPWLGFDQGFDFFESHGRRFEDNQPRIFKWIRDFGANRFFLFLHNFNAHRPYAPPEERLRRHLADVPEVCRGVDFDVVDERAKRCMESEDGEVYLRATYAAEVSYADALLGEVLASLDAIGVLEDTLVVVTSDHGDELLDHGSLDHIKTLYQELVKVPLIVAGPGVPSGRRVAAPVETRWIGPTVLDLLEVTDAMRTNGESLASFWEGSSAATNRAFTATAYDPSIEQLSRYPFQFQAAVVEGPWKLYLMETADGRRELALYDLQEDPGERTNLYEERGAEREELLGDLVVWARELRESRHCSATTVDPATQEQLKALGYAQ